MSAALDRPEQAKLPLGGKCGHAVPRKGVA